MLPHPLERVFTMARFTEKTQTQINLVLGQMQTHANNHGYELDLNERHVLACIAQYKAGWTMEQLFAHYNLTDDTKAAIIRILSN